MFSSTKKHQETDCCRQPRNELTHNHDSYQAVYRERGTGCNSDSVTMSVLRGFSENLCKMHNTPPAYLKPWCVHDIFFTLCNGAAGCGTGVSAVTHAVLVDQMCIVSCLPDGSHSNKRQTGQMGEGLDRLDHLLFPISLPPVRSITWRVARILNGHILVVFHTSLHKRMYQVFTNNINPP